LLYQSRLVYRTLKFSYSVVNRIWTFLQLWSFFVRMIHACCFRHTILHYGTISLILVGKGCHFQSSFSIIRTFILLCKTINWFYI
jgi:hypothetical protein